MPSANMVGSSAEPPYDTSGSGTPMTGSRPSTAPMLTSAWPMIQAVTPAVAIRTKGSSLRTASRKQAQASTANSASTASVPTRPSSSPMIAKMKSVCASGSQPHFSRLAPRPTPHQPPSARAYLPCIAWKQVSSGSGHEPLSQAAIRASRLADVVAEDSARPAITAAAPRKSRAGAPAEKSSAARIEQQHQGGAEVAADQDQPDDEHADGQDHRHQHVRPRGQQRRACGQHGRGPDDQRELGRLGRLQPRAAEGDPVAVAVDRDAERAKTRPCSTSASRTPGQANRCQTRIGGRDARNIGSDAGDREDQLALEDRERGAGVLVRRHRRRRQHHDQAEHEQQQASRRAAGSRR